MTGSPFIQSGLTGLAALGQSENLGFLYPDREGQAGNFLSGPDRSGYLGQSDQPQLFQPVWSFQSAH